VTTSLTEAVPVITTGTASAPRRIRDGISGAVLIVPMAVVVVFLFAVPLARSLYWSITDFDGYSDSVRFVGLSNYTSVFSDPSMVAGLSFTLVYTIGTTVLVTIIAIPLAVVLNRRFLGRNFVRSAFFFPAIPSIAILGLVWGFILSPLSSGVLNSIIGLLGGQKVPWLADPQLAQLSVVVVGVWSQAGWHAILYLAYLQAIPAELNEVSLLDGANGVQRFFYVTLPLLVPAMTISQLLLLTGGLKVYDLPFTLTSGGPGFATNTLTQSIIQRGIAQSQFGQASALAVMFMIVVGLVVAAQLFLSRRLEGRFS
jgi:multiple sugar transport system permease protein/raffinose/stachyose/melibiose transport system permease protein